MVYATATTAPDVSRTKLVLGNTARITELVKGR